jgi:hypothetical protein
VDNLNVTSNDDESGWPDRRRLGKNEKEVEAEVVAFLVASRAGVVTASAQYLKDYAVRAATVFQKWLSATSRSCDANSKFLAVAPQMRPEPD